MTGPSTSPCHWTGLVLGLFYISIQCDARAVNVSNSWTMPQEGLNVFYRFFRDRISWFEADAVCQFHHANLVTVDNSFQFDATRDLLRELDVNDIVWIGLMRPQSSDRFMWSSNSRPLVADTGYWAESLPLMDAPLCAVIDPIRDYRWHALRCGGPETASFLCEMPVPSWAEACIIKDMPNLTIQYMADTASIELIRNCREEGLLRQTCRGKQDRERAIGELICPRERLEAQRINDISNSHFKSLQIINSIRTDNNENNDIELLPMAPNYGSSPQDLRNQAPTEKNTVQKLIEQFNVDELMQADEPSNGGSFGDFYQVPGQIPKPVKKLFKQGLDYPQKPVDDANQWPRKQGLSFLEDMMLGDQPHGEPELVEHVLSDEVSNEVLEPLPHRKKVLYGTTPTTTTTTTITSTSTTTTPTPGTTTVTSSSSTVAASSSSAASKNKEESSAATTTEAMIASGYSSVPTSTITTPLATVGHPLHFQESRGTVMTEETKHAHIQESPDQSHFLPPLLLVKSHYVPPAKHDSHAEHGSHLGQPEQSSGNRSPEHVAAIESMTKEEERKSSVGGEKTTTSGQDSVLKDNSQNPKDLMKTKVEESSEQVTTANPGATTVHFRESDSTVGASNRSGAQNLDLDLDTTTRTTTTFATTSTKVDSITATTATKPIEMPQATTREVESETTKPTSAPTTTTVTATAPPVVAVAAAATEGGAAGTALTTASGIEGTHEPLGASIILATATTTTMTTTTAASATASGAMEMGSSQRNPEVFVPATESQTEAETGLKTKTETATVEYEVDKRPPLRIGGQQQEQQQQTDPSTLKREVIVSKTEASVAAAAAATTFATSTQTPTTATEPRTATMTTTSASITTAAAVHQRQQRTATSPAPTAPTPTHNFLKVSTEQPFKPNRRRSLSKPETVSYLKKILG